MKKLKTVKRGSAFCLIFAVLFLYAATAYCDAAGIRQTAADQSVAELLETDGAMNGCTDHTENEHRQSEQEQINVNSTEQPDQPESGNSGQLEQEQTETESIEQLQTEQLEADAAEQLQTEQSEADATGQPQTELSGSAAILEKEMTEKDDTAFAAEAAENTSDSQEISEASESETECETEEMTEPVTEEATEENGRQYDVEEYWEDCAVTRAGQLSRASNPVIHRDDNMILSYLDFPCYFKYVTGHGQEIGSQTLAVYCLYNTREAPEDEPYQPDSTQAFSKEITYCLYNGCRYKGKTAYNDAYSTGSWKKDYYITQIAIHLINYEQGRESSIEKYLKKSSDSEVYKLVQKMKKDAYADTALTSAQTNQTNEVSYTISPSAQDQWIQMSDGNWRTAADYICSSNKKGRIVSVNRILSSKVPKGVSIVTIDKNDPLSAFYFKATPAAYRQIAQEQLTITAQVNVTAEEYGGWWYKPVKSSVKRQYVTFLMMEAVQTEGKAQASATADYQEQLISLTVYKEGEVLTGAVTSENGTEFQYAKKRLAGAVFDLYAAEVIKNAAGEVVWQKDAVVAKDIQTGADGTATIENLQMGSYYLLEKTAPSGMVLDQTQHQVLLSEENVQGQLGTVPAVIENKRQKAQITVTKLDNDTKQPLAGAVFGIYAEDEIYTADGTLAAAKGTLLEKAVTDTNGKAEFLCDLPIGHHYQLKELQAPSGYVREESQTYSFFINEDAQQEIRQITYTCTNTRCQVRLILYKQDQETGTNAAQGDASLQGAVYGLYAREEIRHPDGHTGIIYQKDEQAAVLETNEQGEAQTDLLYPGKYYLKELKAPEGYVLDEKEYEVQLSCEDDQSAVVEKTAVIKEQVKKQAFQIIKGSDKGDAEPEALQGAGFSAWLISDLTVAEEENTGEGRYDTTDAEPVVIGANGETELFTDEDGYLCTIPLPYGTYLVRETAVPANHKPVEDFIVTITEHSPQQPQPWRILLDECFMAKLKIIKKDSETGKTILKSGGEFKVKNLDTGEYVEQETVYPEQKVHISYFTNEEGALVLPKALEPGTYQIEEIKAPEGYICSSEPVEVTIAADKAFLEDTATGDIVYVQEFFDLPVSGELTIEKRGNVLVGLDGVFQYEEQALSDVTFELLAEDDIWYPDGSDICYEAGMTVATAVTDQNGRAVFGELPLGTYRIREKQAPFGYITDQEGIVAVLTYQGQEIQMVQQETTYYNERQQLKILVKKTDQESGKTLAGAVFGLYVAEDILDQAGKVIAAADVCLNQLSTDQEGTASFDLNLPHGKYYIKEEQAPVGYITNGEHYEIDLSECDGETKEIIKVVEAENKRTECEISKTDITSGEEIPGASLEIRDENGELIEKWVSEETPHKIKGLQPGVLYTLTERTAPYGYIQAESITFQIKDSGEVSQIKMEDAHAKGRIRIKKVDADTKEALAGAVYELRNMNGKILEILTTDKNGEAESNFYEIGSYQDGKFVSSLAYILKEADAPKGYELDDTEYEVRFEYEDDKTPEVVWEKVLEDQKIPSAAPKSVQTGDHTDLFGLLCMVFLSGEALLVLFFFRRKIK